DLTFNGGGDAFVAKVNAAGTALVYAGYIGGDGLDVGSGIAVDNKGNAYVTGSTSSTEASFPVKRGPDLTFNGGIFDAFVAKVSETGDEDVDDSDDGEVDDSDSD
ncbi:MAG: SBBP repeat-containing protein, partial [Burkholderiales bacterium]